VSAPIVAALQMSSSADVARNLAAARGLLEDARAAGAILAVLPENFCFMARHESERRAIVEADGDGPVQRAMSGAARELGLWIVAGTQPIAVPGEPRPANACIVYDADGRRVARYDKIHLFAYDNGSERYDEGRVLEAGDVPVAFEALGLRIGLSVCYDLRFPELFRAMGTVELVVLPSAFTWTTGRAHWEVLLRARAIENQCYLMAPAQGGRHQSGRHTWGHTMVVDPWGEVLACRDEGEGVVLADVEPQRIAAVRETLPALGHRCL
jgi:nitrilase